MYSFYVIIGDMIIDTNDLDIHMLCPLDIEALEMVAEKDPEMFEQAAWNLHVNNMKSVIGKVETIVNTVYDQDDNA